MSAIPLHKHKKKPALLHVKVQITSEIISFYGVEHIEALRKYIAVPYGKYTEHGFLSPNEWAPYNQFSKLVHYHAINKNPDP